jgi:(p)ppGpp synthase/HD superfamily hydrolase
MSTKVALAKALAAHYHGDQKYGDKPYMYHLEQVATNVKLLTNGTEDLLCIAYLHDILEDTDALAVTIGDLFGYELLDSVIALTKYPAFKNNYDKYIERVVENKNALLVKYCDTLANLSASIDDGNQGRISKYTKQLDLLAAHLNEQLEEWYE